MISDNGGVWKYLQIITVGLGTTCSYAPGGVRQSGMGKKAASSFGFRSVLIRFKDKICLFKTDWVFQAWERCFVYSVTAFKQWLKAFPNWIIFWSHAHQQNPNKAFLNQIYTSLHKIFYEMFIDKNIVEFRTPEKQCPPWPGILSWPVIDDDWWCGQNNVFAQIFYGVLHRERVALLCVHQWTIVLTDNFSPQSSPWELFWPTSH